MRKQLLVYLLSMELLDSLIHFYLTSSNNQRSEKGQSIQLQLTRPIWKKKKVEEKKEQSRKGEEMSEKTQKGRMTEKESLANSEEHLNEQEAKARQDLKAADELLKDATSKL